MNRICLILIAIQSVFGNHFRGGMISWRPETDDISLVGTKRTIIIDQRYVWSRSAASSSCTSATITSFGQIGENTVSVLKCQPPTSTCSSVAYTANISTFVPCTDYNTVLGMSFGQSSKALNLTVRSSGVVVGYVGKGDWLTLQLGNGQWSLMMYINMKPRPDNQLINSSPTSNLQPVIYIPASSNGTTTIDIPISDVDGDDLECRFAKASHSLGGVTVNECLDVCRPLALPSSAQLTSGNNTCTLTVKLPAIGYYAVAIQIEDFLVGTSTMLSSVPLQFLILTYDASNPTSSCSEKPIIISIPPNFPAPDDTVVLQVGVLYQAMVIAEIGCENDTDTAITNFITTSPPGMLKTNFPFSLGSATYGINLTWTPAAEQLGKTFSFCASAVDGNYYMSEQYCFNFRVGPRTTTTTTTTSTSTSSSTTTTTTSTSTSSTSTTSVTTTSTTSTTTATTTTPPYDPLPLGLGLGLGLGLPLLLLLSLLGSICLCRWCPSPLRSLLRRRYGHRDDMYCQYCRRSRLFDDPQKAPTRKCATSEDARRYKQPCSRKNDNLAHPQYREQFLDASFLRPVTFTSEYDTISLNASFLSNSTSPLFGSKTTTLSHLYSPSSNSLPAVNVCNPLQLPSGRSSKNDSLLVEAFAKQPKPI